MRNGEGRREGVRNGEAGREGGKKGKGGRGRRVSSISYNTQVLMA